MFAGLFWQAALAFCAVWLAVAYLSRYSSLAALAASAATPLALLFLMGQPEQAALGALMTLLLLWKHRANIGRLRSGEETKIGAKA